MSVVPAAFGGAAAVVAVAAGGSELADQTAATYQLDRLDIQRRDS